MHKICQLLRHQPQILSSIKSSGHITQQIGLFLHSIYHSTWSSQHAHSSVWQSVSVRAFHTVHALLSSTSMWDIARRNILLRVEWIAAVFPSSLGATGQCHLSKPSAPRRDISDKQMNKCPACCCLNPMSTNDAVNITLFLSYQSPLWFFIHSTCWIPLGIYPTWEELAFLNRDAEFSNFCRQNFCGRRRTAVQAELILQDPVILASSALVKALRPRHKLVTWALPWLPSRWETSTETWYIRYTMTEVWLSFEQSMWSLSTSAVADFQAEARGLQNSEKKDYQPGNPLLHLARYSYRSIT